MATETPQLITIQCPFSVTPGDKLVIYKNQIIDVLPASPVAPERPSPPFVWTNVPHTTRPPGDKPIGRPSKLSQQQQAEVRKRLSAGATLKELAKTYNVNIATIQRAVANGHIPTVL